MKYFAVIHSNLAWWYHGANAVVRCIIIELLFLICRRQHPFQGKRRKEDARLLKWNNGNRLVAYEICITVKRPRETAVPPELKIDYVK